MATSDSEYEVLGNDDVIGTDSSGLQPLSAEKIQKIRDWLDPSDFAAESNDYKRHLRSYVADTDTWTHTPQYQQWTKGSEHGALWIKAVPGAGKSVVAASIISHRIEAKKGPVLFLFFRQIIATNCTSRDLLRDWSAQILEHSPYLQRKLEKYGEGFRDFKYVSFDELWTELTKALCFLPSVLCVADALDEMSDGNDDFIEKLAGLGALKPTNVKVLMTSRIVPRIERTLRDITSVMPLTLTAQMSLPAVEVYIQHRLADLMLAEQTHTNVKRELLTRSGGLFLYVKLMMDDLWDNQPIDAASITKKVENLPVGLSAMYTRMLHDHSSRSKVPQRLQIAILRWVTHSARPLRVLELATIIDSLITNELLEDVPDFRALHPNTKAMIRVACGPLVEILEDETVSIIHHSLTEYIVDASRNDSTTIEWNMSGFPTIGSASSHSEMAKTCLQYLTGDWAKEWQYQSRWSNSFKSQVASLYSVNSFLKYAATYWSHHARLAANFDYNLIELLDLFMSSTAKHLEAWRKLKQAEADDSRGKKFDNENGALHLAAKEGLATYAEHLMLKQHPLDNVNSKQNTSLHLAAESGYANVAALLIRHGALTDEANFSGCKPLHLAAIGGHGNVVRLLLAAGVDPKTPKTKEDKRSKRWHMSVPVTLDRSPMEYACRSSHTKAVLEFAPHLTSEELLMATHWAFEMGNCETVLAILNAYKIDINRLVYHKTLVHYAAYWHDLDTLIKLQELKASFDTLCCGYFGYFYWARCEKGADHMQSTPLHAFAKGRQMGASSSKTDREKSLRALQLLLKESGCEMNAKDANGETALHLAVQRGFWSSAVDPTMIEALLQNGADAKAQNTEGAQVLHYAREDQDIINTLVNHGADINARISGVGKTPLHCCFDHHRGTNPHALLEAGADPNVRDMDGNSPLHFALERCSTGELLSRVQLLLSYGSDPNAANQNGEAPLHLANWDYGGTKEVIELLVNAGADAEAKTIDGRTVLMTIDWDKACRFENDVLDIMLAAGSKFDSRDYAGRTLLHYLCKWPSTAPFIRRVIEKGQSPHVVDFAGNSMFHHFARHRYDWSTNSWNTLYNLLHELGVNPNARNNQGQTPLHIAVGKCRSRNRWCFDFEESIELFSGTDSQTNINVVDNHGIAPIHLAATKSLPRVKKLLDMGANLLSLTSDGQSMLHIASRARDSNLVGFLTEHFAEKQPSLLDHTDRDGRTALHHACRSGRVESVKILLDAGANVNVVDKKGRTPLHACSEIPEEQRLWRHSNDDSVEPRFIEAVGIALSDTQRPQEGGTDCESESSIYRILCESDSICIRPMVRLLVAYGAITSAPESALNFYNKYGVSRPLPRKSPLQYAIEKECGVVIDELTTEKDSPSYDLPDLRDQSLVGILLRRFCRSGHMLYQVYSNQDLKPSKEKVVADLDLVHYLLRTENEQGLLELREVQGELFQSLDPQGPLKTMVKYGFSKALSLVGPEYPLIAAEISAQGYSGESASPLHIACSRHLPNLNVLKVLVDEKKFDVNIKSNKTSYLPAGSTALHFLAWSPRWWKAQGIGYLIDQGANINLKDDEGMTPLLVATKERNSKNVKVLLERGADTNIIADNGMSCLNVANSAETCQLLLSYGANAAAGEHPFILNAINLLDYGLVEAVLRSGVDPNVAFPYSKQNRTFKLGEGGCLHLDSIQNDAFDLIYPIHLAASRVYNNQAQRQQALPIIKLLLRNGANSLIECSTGQSILHSLCEHEGIIEPLLDGTDLDVERRNSLGNTPLLSACLRTTRSVAYDEERYQLLKTLPPMIAYLLEKGADISAVNNKDQNALHCLFNRQRYDKGKILLTRDFETIMAHPSAPELVSQKDKDGLTPLLCAVKHCELSYCDAFTTKGADNFATDHAGFNALHYLAVYVTKNKHSDDCDEPKPVFQDFLALGLDINSRTKDGRTPLFIALETARLTASDIAFFTEAGAQVPIVNDVGQNLLHVVASKPAIQSYRPEAKQNADADMWNLLIEKRLDPIDEDDLQRTPFDLAVASGNESILALAKRKQ